MSEPTIKDNTLSLVCEYIENNGSTVRMDRCERMTANIEKSFGNPFGKTSEDTAVKIVFSFIL